MARKSKFTPENLQLDLQKLFKKYSKLDHNTTLSREIGYFISTYDFEWDFLMYGYTCGEMERFQKNGEEYIPIHEQPVKKARKKRRKKKA